MLGNVSAHAVRWLFHFRVHADVRICGGNLRRNFCLHSESAHDHTVHSGVSSADTGKNLYYSAMAIIASDWTGFQDNIVLLILYAVGIAIGLAVVVELERIVKKLPRKKR